MEGWLCPALLKYFAAAPNIFLTIDIFLCVFVGLYLWKKLEINWMDWAFLSAGIFLIIYWRVEPEYRYVLWIMI